MVILFAYSIDSPLRRGGIGSPFDRTRCTPRVNTDGVGSLPVPMVTRVRTALSKAVAAFARPEYTGENRCWPCTGINLLVLAVGVAVAQALSPLTAAVLAVGGLGAIAVRGYVVPYTPRFAPVLLDRLPVDVSKGSPDQFDAGAVAAGEADGEAVLGVLVEAGVVCGEAELVLDEAFREEWRAAIDAAREGDLAAELEATIPGVTAERYDWQGEDWYSLASESGTGESKSLSRQVAIADVAAVRTLTDRGIDRAVACRAARPLRQFLAACPACDAALTVRNDSCCGGFGPGGPTDVLACDDCENHVFVYPD